jgi:membrane protease YdiL (CAAX protease family)
MPLEALQQLPPALLATITPLLGPVLLLAGLLLCLQLPWRYRHDPALHTSLPTGVARLQARRWPHAEVILLLCALLLPTLNTFLMPRPAPTASTPPPHLYAVLTFLGYYILLCAGILFTTRRLTGTPGAALGTNRHNWPSAIRTGIELGLAMLPPVLLLAWLSDLLCTWLGFTPDSQEILQALQDPRADTPTRALLIFLAVVAAPIAEEAAFRGVIFPSLLQRRPLWQALLLTNLLFAAMHLHAPSILPLMLVGCALSFGMLLTGSLLTPIVMHAIFNGEMLLLLYAWPSLSGGS